MNTEKRFNISFKTLGVNKRRTISLQTKYSCSDLHPFKVLCNWPNETIDKKYKQCLVLRTNEMHFNKNELKYRFKSNADKLHSLIH